MTNYRCIFLMLMLAGLAVSHADAAVTKKPNFIIYMSDDIGYDPFGCAGNEYAKTPHIDKLAEEGVVFDRLYATVAQCSPCRYELFSGLYPRNNGVLSNGMINPVLTPKTMDAASHCCFTIPTWSGITRR